MTKLVDAQMSKADQTVGIKLQVRNVNAIKMRKECFAFSLPNANFTGPSLPHKSHCQDSAKPATIINLTYFLESTIINLTYLPFLNSEPLFNRHYQPNLFAFYNSEPLTVGGGKKV